MVLYKYYSCNEFTYRSLSEMGLWFGNISTMNDPFDCLWNLEVRSTPEDMELLRQYVKGNIELSNHEFTMNIPELSDSGILQLLNHLKWSSSPSQRYCSLTEDPYNILMWSHYASGHKGIVVGFNFNDFTNIIPIEYTDSIPLVNPIEFVNWTFLKKANSNNILFKSLSKKTVCWEYEKEWRVWKNDDSNYFHYLPKTLFPFILVTSVQMRRKN